MKVILAFEERLKTLPVLIRESLPRRHWDWQAVALTIALIQISSARLTITEWAPFLYFTQTLGFFGTLLGLILGLSNFRRNTILRLATGYSIIILPAHWLNAVTRTDLLWADLIALAERLLVSLGQFMRNQPVYDPLFFVSIASVGYWIVGLWSGYQLTRHTSFLHAVLPAGLIMLVVQVFDPVKTIRVWSLGVYLFTALVLLGRLYHLESRKNWKKSRTHVTPESSRDLSNFVLIAAFVSIFLAWSFPGMLSGIRPAMQAWEEFIDPIFERLSDATQALDAENSDGYGSGGDFYSSDISLGQSTATGDTPVFYVQLVESEFIPLRFYWRGRVYGLYINGRWTNSGTERREFIPDTDEITVEYPRTREEMQFSFTNKLDSQALMYSPAEAVWMSRTGSWVARPASTEGSGAPDVSAWLAEPILGEDDQYQVRALLADPTIEDLRSAGIEYPDWVLRDYLQIPENIQEQLISLTREITAPHETPYDKAVAITSYLREEIEYEGTLTQSPPPNMDPVLWVLFEYKKAFCMYSASAEVLMLRSIGIPARLAVGFVEGTINEADRTYTVTYDNSHAWPEIFFPGIGWVEFEPTGNQTPLIRPETSFAAEQEADSFNPRNDDLRILDEGTFPGAGNPSMFLNVDLQSGMNPAGQTRGYAWVPVLAFLLAGMLVLNRRYSLSHHLPAYLAARILQGGNQPPAWLENWTRWISLSEVERSFQAVNLSLFWLGHPQPRSITPRERTSILIQHLPSAQADVTSLLHQYHTELYTPRAAQVNVARSAAVRILVKTWLARVQDSLEILNRRYNQLK